MDGYIKMLLKLGLKSCFPGTILEKSRAGNVSEGRARPKESLSRGSERADDM